MRHPFLLIAALLVALIPSVAQAQVYGDSSSLVDYWYRTYLGRAPDPASSYWVNQLNQGVTPDSVLSSIIGSDEYYVRSGSTPQGYVTLMYNDILRRAPTPAELNYWVGRMYTTARPAIADALLTQNPGMWVARPTPPPPAAVTPRPGWERDRRWDWDRHHEIHEYHRPGYPFYRDHHDDHDRRP